EVIQLGHRPPSFPASNPVQPLPSAHCYTAVVGGFRISFSTGILISGVRRFRIMHDRKTCKEKGTRSVWGASGIGSVFGTAYPRLTRARPVSVGRGPGRPALTRKPLPPGCILGRGQRFRPSATWMATVDP